VRQIDMRPTTILSLVLILGTAVAAGVGWRKAGVLAEENARLRQQLAALETDISAAKTASEAGRAEAQKAQQHVSELMKLRNEATQLRNAGQEMETLRADNARLRGENQQLRSGAGAAAASASSGPQAIFPKESWSFAGYTSPESALLSAIWAMKNGDPKIYLDSLTPAEQERMAQLWRVKSEQEVAAKHQQDVAPIAGLRVLNKQQVSPTEILMDVYVDGPNRNEKVRMQQVGTDWKFGGFIREQAAP